MAGGSIIFLSFIIIFFFAIAVRVLHRASAAGSTRAPYGKLYGGAPGADVPGEVSGHDPRLSQVRDWSRGCR